MAAKRQGRPQPTAVGRESEDTHINKQVLPQAPSPTMTSFLRSSAAMVAGDESSVMKKGIGMCLVMLQQDELQTRRKIWKSPEKKTTAVVGRSE
jgi:hypothetical protein